MLVISTRTIKKLSIASKFMSIDDIEEKLRSMEVGIGKEAPVKLISFIIYDYDTGDTKLMPCQMYITATMHQDGRRDFCSKENIDSIMQFIEDKGEIITFN